MRSYSTQHKNRPEFILLFVSLIAGVGITALTWVTPNLDITSYILISTMFLFGTAILVGRRYSTFLRASFILGVFAAIALIYLFPELFSPGCGGMPKAFAGPCPPECQITVCTDWDAPGENGCNAKPPDKGCCRSYGTTCAPDCPEDPPPPPPDEPPSLTANLNCTLNGNNGWCRGTLSLDLTATESKGRSILISGEVNGTPFSCPTQAGTASCSIPLPEGTGMVNYTATSEIGLSANGSTAFKRDSLAPMITKTLTGSLGQNGWYVSSVSYTATATDPTSGVSGLTCTLDSAPQATCNPISVTTDGAHTVSAEATDNAGNSVTSTQTVSIDTQPPTLTAALSGTSGNNGWYKAATLNATASDPTPGSGLTALEYALDGGAWTAFSSSYSLPDGVHTLEVRAQDGAGHITQATPLNAQVDSLAPSLVIAESGTLGANGWYISQPEVSASATDVTSGLALLEYSLNNGPWTTYTTPLTIPEGLHTLAFWAEDRAGWVTQETHTLKVDTRLPQIGGNLSGTPGRDPLTGQSTGWYISNVTLTANASDPTPGSGLHSFSYRLGSGADTPYLVPLTLSDGQPTVTFTATDFAGLQATQSQALKVDTVPPTLQVLTSLPTWIKDTVPLNGSAADPSASLGQVPSGLLRVEISLDNGLTWQTVNGASSWNYAWNTRTSADGANTLRVRAVDAAGLSTTVLVPAQVDNTPPRINLPAAWNIWDSVPFNARDDQSGLAGAELIISDPQNRWPKRTFEFAPGHLPVDFQWDRRFADGTVAPMGDYNVKATATDNLGNTRVVTATIHISLAGSILPPPAEATPLGLPLPTATPTATVLPPTPTATSTVPIEPQTTGFGVIALPDPFTPTPTAQPVLRATPTPGSFLNQILSLFNPQPTPEVTTSEITEPARQAPLAATTAQTPSNILWGAAATAAVGAFAAFIAQKKREEEEEARAERAERKNSAAQNKRLTPEDKRAQALRAAIAAVTAKEQKDWKAERYAQISQTEAYKNSDNKTQFMHNELAKIKADEAYYRQKQQEENAQKAAPSQPPMPPGLSPEAQQAFLHSAAAANWVQNNAPALQAQYQAELAKRKREEELEQARSERMEAKMERLDAEDEAKWERAQKAIAEQAYQDFRAGERNMDSPQSEKSKTVESQIADVFVKAITFFRSIPIIGKDPALNPPSWLLNFLSGMGDPSINPVSTAFRNQVWDGVDGWAFGVKSAANLGSFLGSAIKDRRSDDIVKGLQLSKVAYDGVGAASKTMLWEMVKGVVTTPYRLVTVSIPQFAQAVSDRWQGKRGAWDVIFTAANLEGDIVATFTIATTGVKVYKYANNKTGGWQRAIWGDPASRHAKVSLDGFVERAFKGNWNMYNEFIEQLKVGLPENTKVFARGSSTNGFKWTTGRPFDGNGAGTSDIDLVLVGDDAMKMWRPSDFKIPGAYTSNLGNGTANVAPKLNALRVNLQELVGRPVNIQAMSEVYLNTRILIEGMKYLKLLP